MASPPTPKVLHIVYNLIRGGTEGQCARTALGLQARGGRHRVAVFERKGFFLEQVEAACGGVYTLPVRTVKSFSALFETRRFARWIREEKFDLVHAWDMDAALFGGLAARWAGCPLVTSHRDLGEIYPPWKLAWRRKRDADARAVVVNAKAIARAFADSVAAEKFRRIPNIVDLEEFDQRAARLFAGLDLLPPGPKVVMVCRLDPEKDGATFVRAADAIQQQCPDAGFVVAGEGVDKAKLESLAKEKGLSERMVFLGEVHEVAALLGQCSVGVLVPRTNEGLSNTILEYMAAGLPVVTTDCGGNRELVEEGVSGYVVAAGDPRRVAEQVVRLLRDRERAKRMGAEGRRRVEEHHAPDHVLDQFAELYRACS